MQDNLIAPAVTESDTDMWFDNLVAQLRTHQLQLDTNTATDELRNFYNTLFSANQLNVANQSRNMAQQIIVPVLIGEYIDLALQQKPLKIAFDFNDSEVLVWAQINDNDSVTEQQLYLAEAKINAKFHEYGYDMTTMIVETSDNCNIPNHYKVFID